MQCNDCVFYNGNCTAGACDEDWEDLATEGECPGYYGKETARYDERVRFAEKG